MNSQMKGLAISFGVMQLSRKVPTDRPDVLFIIRCTYILSVLLQAGLFFLASQKVKKRNDTTVLKYQEPPKGFGGGAQPGDPTVTTNRDYDLSQISKNFPQLAIGIVIMAVMHLRFKYTQPLLLQSIMPLKGLYDNPIIKIWILGQRAEGDLARPFKQPAGLMSALQDANAASNDGINRAEAETASTIPQITEIEEESKKDL
ncbi:MAG: hypothetical protein CYPHOPRED_005853 [Cyphobasidiales sp. Tagirdzhanova-0007]|nr:MAG: hypothetical protein CYPHOPRED_005853 [Cyphobasidiales sp. Tagirdzhanova-0007]